MRPVPPAGGTRRRRRLRRRGVVPVSAACPGARTRLSEEALPLLRLERIRRHTPADGHARISRLSPLAPKAHAGRERSGGKSGPIRGGGGGALGAEDGGGVDEREHGLGLRLEGHDAVHLVLLCGCVGLGRVGRWIG